MSYELETWIKIPRHCLRLWESLMYLIFKQGMKPYLCFAFAFVSLQCCWIFLSIKLPSKVCASRTLLLMPLQCATGLGLFQCGDITWKFTSDIRQEQCYESGLMYLVLGEKDARALIENQWSHVLFKKYQERRDFSFLISERLQLRVI